MTAKQFNKKIMNRFLKNFEGHNSVINTLAINEDGVLFSGGDNGSMAFWDYNTGHCFQQTQTIVQPGNSNISYLYCILI